VEVTTHTLDLELAPTGHDVSRWVDQLPLSLINWAEIFIFLSLSVSALENEDIPRNKED
jgi:hypothetical protein